MAILYYLARDKLLAYVNYYIRFVENVWWKTLNYIGIWSWDQIIIQGRCIKKVMEL